MVEIKQLPNLDIQKIIHISDIHMRLFKRKEEYLDVFETLYKQLEPLRNNATLAILAGDIIHSKTEMSPEMVQMAFGFLKKIADMFPTILIPGNHDANLNNPSRLDALSPIVNNLKHDNLFYLKDSGLYQMGKIIFSVMGIFEKKDEYIDAYEIPEGFTKIALYHGTVNNAHTESGFKVTNSKINISHFAGFDMAIFGDIHKRQELSRYDTEEAIIDETEWDLYRREGWVKMEVIEETSTKFFGATN